MLKGFTCPIDNKPISFADCKAKCRGNRCYPLPVLNKMSEQREYNIEEIISGVKTLSTTMLLAPTWYTYLRLTNPYFQSPHDLLFMVMGSGYHYFLEEEMEGCLQEEKLKDDISTGIVDLYEEKTKTLYDYKFLGKYKIQRYLEDFDNEAHDLVYQINRYRELLEKAGHPVEKMIAVCFARDFSMGIWRRELSYVGKLKKDGSPYKSPVAPCVQFDIPKVNVSSWFKKRATALIGALKGNSVDVCEEEDRWGDRRCHDYCAVNKFCSYYKELIDDIKNKIK